MKKIYKFLNAVFMKNVSIRFVTAMAFVLSALTALAQDPTFSQYDANQIYYNPAYAGYKKAVRFGATYRNLWPNVPGKKLPGPLGSYSFTGDAYFNIKDRFTGGGGAFVMQDVEGVGYLTTTTAGIMYSQHMPKIKGRNDRMDRWNIYLGFKAYMGNIHVDWSRYVFSDQLDVNYGVANPSSFNQDNIVSKFYFDFDFGIVIRNNYRAKGKWFNEFGFSMSHVLAPTISITGSASDASRLPRKYVATYRSNIAVLKDNFYIGPTILFENQGRFFAVNGGLDFYVRFKHRKNESIPLSVGVYNRFSFILKDVRNNRNKINTSAIILSVTHRGNFASGKYATGYSVGFSVDFPYMGLGMQTAGAYEITAGITIPYKKRDVLTCPFEAY